MRERKKRKKRKSDHPLARQSPRPIQACMWRSVARRPSLNVVSSYQWLFSISLARSPQFLVGRQLSSLFHCSIGSALNCCIVCGKTRIAPPPLQSSASPKPKLSSSYSEILAASLPCFSLDLSISLLNYSPLTEKRKNAPPLTSRPSLTSNFLTTCVHTPHSDHLCSLVGRLIFFSRSTIAPN